MAESASTPAVAGDDGDGESRRDFLFTITGMVAGAGALAAVWPFIDSMNPAKDVQALASTAVDLSAVEVGQAITVIWRGKPIFIRHRTEEEIVEAQDVQTAAMIDPETDAERVQDGKAEWLVVVGICTHLGCIPLGQKPADPKGDYGGWFCPCHGSHYDTSGRIRKGPAPLNLAVPPYAFEDDTSILIG